MSNTIPSRLNTQTWPNQDYSRFKAKPKDDSGKSGVANDKIAKTAKEFEAMALGEMLQPMFDTVDNSDGKFGGGQAEKQFQSMQVLELGKQVAKAGGIGIAHQVYGKMKEMAEAGKK